MSYASVWPTVRLGDVIEAKYGKALRKASRNGGPVPVYGSNGVVGGHDTPLSKGPTIVIGRKGSSGAINMSDVPCWPIDTTYFIDEPGPYWLPFLELLLRSLRLDELDRSTAIPGLSREQLYDLEVPVPPRDEQREIADLIGQVERRTESAGAHLATGRRAGERFRQAMLLSACAGRLTAEWRRHATHHDASGDSSVDTSELPPIPTTWAYRRMDTLNDPAAVIGYGIVLPGPQVHDGVPYVRQQDVIGGTVRADGLGRTTEEIANKHSRSSLLEGDVLLCIIRNLRVAIVPAGLDGANITQGMVRIRPGERVIGRYLAAYLASPYAQRWMKDQYVGLAMPRINVADARAIPVPVPPIEEQAEIVRRLDELLGVAQRVEEHLEVLERQLERTSQSILAKAFRGELAPLADAALVR